MPGVFFIRSANTLNNQFHLVFLRNPGKLFFMRFTAYSYYWRFTYRTTQERGAGV